MDAMSRLRTIVNGSKKFKTLAGRSAFTAVVRKKGIFITNSKGNTYEVRENVAKAVTERFRHLPRHEIYMASAYTVPKWTDCPHMILSPYIAAILRDE
jgi:hypothetical protein